MSSKLPLLITLGLALALSTKDVRAQTEVGAQEEDLESVGGRGFVSVSLVGAFPTGAFKEYVGPGYGFGGYVAYGVDRRGIIGFRLDAQYVV